MRKIDWLLKEEKIINNAIKEGVEIIYTDWFYYTGNIKEYRISQVEAIYIPENFYEYQAYYDEGLLVITEIDWLSLLWQALGVYY